MAGRAKGLNAGAAAIQTEPGIGSYVLQDTIEVSAQASLTTRFDDALDLGSACHSPLRSTDQADPIEGWSTFAP
jgi:hypothetical protein